ncbi:MAG: hypothetical protein AAFV45_06745 [Pseudomonadota bacterium]
MLKIYNVLPSAHGLNRTRISAVTLCALLATMTPTSPSFAIDTENPDWPCVQRKVETLTATQIWDGPPISGEEKWWKDEDVRKLVPVLTSRRIPIEEAEAEIEKIGEATPEAQRDTRMTLLFAGVLDETNKVRRRVVAGIERFQKRQRARAEALEKKGVELAELHQRADDGEKISSLIDDRQRSYDWDARIFKERQDNLPIACEIPVEIEQRAFSIGRTIRFQMSE